MDQAWLAEFMERERLPPAFRKTVERICRPLAALALEARTDLGRSAVIGLCGPQGSGKSTVAAVAAKLVRDQGLSGIVLSLDDLYLPHEDRVRLAREVHPLLITRGPPGTHDPQLGLETLAALGRPGEVSVPRFDKAADTRRPREAWDRVDGPVDAVIFEGWCVGARPQPAEALVQPVNALERDEDSDGRWRGFVNAQLAGPYAALFATLDRFTFLQPPGFEVVAGWRAEQEDKLRARTGGGMAPDEVARFVAHYERLTRWMLAEAPGRADLLFPLGADRTPS
jgi:D-glycerate 3-kinase